MKARPIRLPPQTTLAQPAPPLALPLPPPLSPPLPPLALPLPLPPPPPPLPLARHHRRQGGIALLEAMLAIVILGIGLLGTIGLQARAYSALSDAGMRAEATMAGEKLLGVMTADAANLASYRLAAGGNPGAAIAPWLAETRMAIPGAVVSVNVVRQTVQTQVDIAIRWQRKANTAQNQHLVTSYIAN